MLLSAAVQACCTAAAGSRALHRDLQRTCTPLPWLPAVCLPSPQVGELSASRASVYSGGGAVAIKRLFGLTVDVLSAGGPVSIGSVYADRAAVSTAGPTGAAAAAGGGAASSPGAGAGIGQRAAAAAAAAAGGSGGRLHVGHIACLKGEARLESGGGALEVDGLEGNAALLSSGGDIKVRFLLFQAETFWRVKCNSQWGGHVGMRCVASPRCLHGPCLQPLAPCSWWLQAASFPAAACPLTCPSCLQVHLHEQAGLVYVDSGGGTVTAWVSPAGSPLGLQVKAAGGVDLDPALKVGEKGCWEWGCWCAFGEWGSWVC